MARVEPLPPDTQVALAQGGAFLNWREKLEGNAEAVETTEDGWPALVASGRLHYLAGWPDDLALADVVERRQAVFELLRVLQDARPRLLLLCRLAGRPDQLHEARIPDELLEGDVFRPGRQAGRGGEPRGFDEPLRLAGDTGAIVGEHPLAKRRGREADEVGAREVGADAFLAKPVDVRQLVELLDGHPLAIDVTRAVISGPGGYVKWLERMSGVVVAELDHLGQRVGSLTADHETSISATMALSIERLGGNARVVLTALACYAPPPIPLSIIDAVSYTHLTLPTSDLV